MKLNKQKMRELFYYILAAIGGGIMSEINTPEVNSGRKDLKKFFIRGFTSVMIGVVFGLLFEVMTGNVRITIAISSLAGFSGIQSIEWVSKILKDKVEKNIPK